MGNYDEVVKTVIDSLVLAASKRAKPLATRLTRSTAKFSRSSVNVASPSSSRRDR